MAVRADCLIRISDGEGPAPSRDAEAVFVGVRPSRTAHEADYGHLWLVFGAQESACGGKNCAVASGPATLTRPVEDWIGYYPATPDLPEGVYTEGQGSAVSQFLRYFWENHVPGVRQVDVMAYSLAARYTDQVSWVGVFGPGEHLAPAFERARLDGDECQLDGRYGLNTDVPGVNNCVSWAAGEVMDRVLDEEHRFLVENPPRLRAFMERVDNCRCRMASDNRA